MCALSSDELVQALGVYRLDRTRPLAVLWATVSASRSEVLGQLEKRLRGQAVVPLRVLGERFSDPNSIGSDLVALLEANRAAVEERLHSIEGEKLPLVILLLSYRDLALPQVDSPVQLPEWLGLPECEMSVPIADLTWRESVSLSEMPHLDELCRLVTRAEAALQRRLSESLSSDCTCVPNLLKIPGFANGASESPVEVLRGAQSALSALKKEEDFRPSLRPKRTLVERIYGIAQSNSHSSLHAAAKTLARALRISQLETSSHKLTIVSVLYRQYGIQSPQDAFALDIIAHIAVAARLITATHHAMEYPLFPPLSLRAVSLELRRALISLCEVLQSQDVR